MNIKSVIKSVEHLRDNGEGYLTEDGEKLLNLLTDSKLQDLIIIR